MKRILFLIPLLPLLGLMVLNFYQPPAPEGQEGMSDYGITMLPSTQPVDLELQKKVMFLLAEEAPARSVFVYAITDVTQKDGYKFIC